MADTTAAPAPAKTPKKAAGKPKKPANHPTYQEMIVTAIGELKEHKGSSRQAIFKYIVAHYSVGHDAKQINAHLRQALKRAASNGVIKLAKGTGAAGSFRIGERKKAAKKPEAAKVKKAKEAGAKKPIKAKKAKAAAVVPPTRAAEAKPKQAAKKPKSPNKSKTPRVEKPKARKRPQRPPSPRPHRATPQSAHRPFKPIKALIIVLPKSIK